jgi:omega-hydroxy-beta-dihydromenaquinone-9 sulfotransferase
VTRRLKHRWSLSHNYLAGITAGMWWKLLRENRFAVDPAYWHRAAFISLASLVNSYYRRQEDHRFAAAIDAVQITRPPLFILGHWRSGTTLLHYLLSQDTTNFAFANTYQVVNPGTFLTTEEVNTRRFAKMVPPTRPMDNMKLSFQSPQEEEFAPLLLTLHSLYLGVSFPRHADQYDRYLTFRDVPREQVDAWKAALHWFCRKLTLKYNRALVLKSPPHTARVRLLLEMFPDARFVLIHRNPYRVFQSQRHFFDTAIWYTYLQRPDAAAIEEGILERYRIMFETFCEDRPRIDNQRFCEVRFEDLQRDPLAEVRTIYESLSIDGFQDVEPRLRSYVASLSGYRKNEHAPLDEPTRRRVADVWRPSFERWGYSLSAEGACTAD